MAGKWSQSGVPHKGWTCVDVEDLGTVDAVCEMCETREIRYVHHMEHMEYSGSLGVGCVCAEKLEDDYSRPRMREQALKNATRRRQHWLSRKWKTSAKGNPYLNTDGMNIVVFNRRPRVWSARIRDRSTGQEMVSRREYRTEDAAKLAAFDAMIFLKEERGWGS